MSCWQVNSSVKLTVLTHKHEDVLFVCQWKYQINQPSVFESNGKHELDKEVCLRNYIFFQNNC